MSGTNNPFEEPIKNHFAGIFSMKWQFPYLHNICSGLVILAVLIVLLALYPTVGIFLQISNTLCKLLTDAQEQFSSADSNAKLGHAVSVGILFAVNLPIYLISLPFFGFSRIIGFFLSK